MKRAIVTQAALPAAALAELKQWLGITTAHDDAPLSDLLQTGIEICEAFTGAMPLEAECEEILTCCRDWQALATQPVQAITGLESIDAEGLRSPIPAAGYAIELDGHGRGWVRVSGASPGVRFAVRFTAGIAAQWDALPAPLRHGLIRLAAHQHRQRDGDGAAPLPPAAVAALWRPWRRMRLT